MIKVELKQEINWDRFEEELKTCSTPKSENSLRALEAEIEEREVVLLSHLRDQQREHEASRRGTQRRLNRRFQPYSHFQQVEFCKKRFWAIP